MRARLHVRGRRLGFFREGTHEVCDARQTRQLLASTSDVLDRLSAGLRSLGLDGVHQIELSENVEATDRVVYLDAAAAIDPRALERLGATDGLTGLVSPSGAHGPAHVTDRLVVDESTVTFQRHVLAFFQGNRYLLRDLVAHVVEQVPIGSGLVDMYAGVGLFSMTAAAVKGASVVAIEGDRFAAADLAANVATSGIPLTTIHGSVENWVGESVVTRLRASVGGDPKRPVCETVIVDPPRTGMSREALAGAIELCAPRLVYVSCDVATLARDARRLADAGYTVARVDAFDLFPNTPHVETVVVFTR
jgi:tRNA/tmRNA/rRNA uracil-C5-methylase (TrmA/RlmC/RlmD family)